MCRVFANQPVASYEPETRSFRLRGHATSIRLERAFWAILEEIAARQGVALPRFLTALHDEVLELHGECANFASVVRCSCLKYVGEKHLTEVRNDDGVRHGLATRPQSQIEPEPPSCGSRVLA